MMLDFNLKGQVKCFDYSLIAGKGQRCSAQLALAFSGAFVFSNAQPLLCGNWFVCTWVPGIHT